MINIATLLIILGVAVLLIAQIWVSKTKTRKSLTWIFGIVAVVGVLGLLLPTQLPFLQGAVSLSALSVGTSDNGVNTPAQVSSNGVLCSSTLGWTGTVSVQNLLNTTTVETYDTSANFYEVNADGKLGTLKLASTDTTAGSTALDCGKTYSMRIVSSSGEGSDTAKIESSSLGTVDADGFLTFSTTGTGQVVTVKSTKHGLAEMRAFDVIDNAFSYEHTGTIINTNYVNGTAIKFGSTTNMTNTTVSTGSELHKTLTIRAQNDATNVNDLGIYVLVDANSNKWNTPTVKIDGVVAQEVKSQLNADEAKAYSSYEYVYKIPATRQITRTNSIEIDYSNFALAGVDPAVADSPVIGLATIGRYASTADSTVLKVGSVKDDSSQTAVHLLQTVTLYVA